MNLFLKPKIKKATAIGSSLVLASGLLFAGVLGATPAAAATVSVATGVKSLGVIAVGANGGNASTWPPSPVPGGTGAHVTSVLGSEFSAGDVLDFTAGTGGAGSNDGDNGAGGGMSIVRNDTQGTDLVIAGGGGGATRTPYPGNLSPEGWREGGKGGDAGADPSGAGGDGAGRDTLGGKGGAGGVGGIGGIGAQGNGVDGGVVNGGDSMTWYGTVTGAVGANGGGGTRYYDTGGSGGAGYGGGGGGGAASWGGGEAGSFGGAGGAGGSYSAGSTHTFEQANRNPQSAGNGTNGSATVTWIEPSVVTVEAGENLGSLDVSWTTPGFLADSDQLGSISYKVTRDGEEIRTTSSSSFTDYPGPGTHEYVVESIAPLNNKAGNKVGDLKTDSDATTSEVVPNAAPTATDLTPQSGPAAGGTTVTINGTNLIGATVKVGGKTCTDVVVNSTGTSLTCVTPTGTGDIPVIVTNSGGSVNAGSFSYQGGPAPAPVKKPNKPRNVSVSGTAKSSKRVVRWKAPVNVNGERPVTYYRIKLNRVRCSNLIVNKRLSKKATSYTFKRSLLLKNLTCRTQRGESKPKQGVFQVRIEAFNSTGGGPVAVTRLTVRR